MAPRSTPAILHRAAELRHDPTPAEARLWITLRKLRAQSIHFRRQHAIGPYTTDFCAHCPRLVVELDGSPHLQNQEYETKRTIFLAEMGYRVLRF